MSAQPKALQIAVMLEASECCKAHGGLGSHPATCSECPRTAADELRRLHAANAELATALQDVIGWIPGRAGFHTDEPSNARARARAALAKHKGAS